MNRLKAYLVMGLAYVLACGIGWAVFLAFNASTNYVLIIVGLLCADVVATIVIWIFGLLFKNSSFYDAYWSLIPFLIILGIMLKYNLWNVNNIVFLAVFGVWSWRLTLNWAYTCTGLKCEDWRYDQYRRENSKPMWHIINFFGIMLMPTLLVFLGTVPAILFVLKSSAQFSPLMLIGCAIILIGTALELFADLSMHKFKRTNSDPNAVLNIGLWKYSRHPNYFGEILIWFGVYFTALFTIKIGLWWAIGCLAILCLFLFASIPLAEKRQLKKRPAYQQYVNQTRMLLPLPKKQG